MENFSEVNKFKKKRILLPFTKLTMKKTSRKTFDYFSTYKEAKCQGKAVSLALLVALCTYSQLSV